jgi:hypothetical protein
VRTPRACQPKRVNPTHGERVHLFAGASSSDRRHIAERGSVQDEICRRCQDRRNTCKWPRSVRDARRPPASGAGHSAFGISGSKRQPPAIRGAGYVLEPRSAAVDRESHRAYRTPLGLSDPSRPRDWAEKTHGGRSTTQRPGSLSRSGRCLVQHTPAASRLVPTSMSVESSTSSTTPFSTVGPADDARRGSADLVYPRRVGP